MPEDVAADDRSPQVAGEIAIGHILTRGIKILYHSRSKSAGAKTRREYHGSYRRCLTARKIHGGKVAHSLQVSSLVTDAIARVPIMLMAIVIFGLAVLWGFHAGCKDNSLLDLIRSPTCGFSVSDIERVPVNTTNGQAISLHEERERVTETRVRGPIFNSAEFQIALLTLGVILGFARWQIASRELGISEVFQRKKEVNALLFESKALRKLVSDATAKDQPQEVQDQKLAYDDRECREVIRALIDEYDQSNDNGGTPDEMALYQQKIFVFMELDNLEFAFMKYRAGMLDAEQMYRAFEIFESRCQNRKFRRLAAVQGLKFYTDEFHQVVGAALLYADAATRGREQP